MVKSMPKLDNSIKDDIKETSEMKTKNESKMVGGSSGCLFKAVCPGYVDEAKFSLTFEFDSLNEKPRTENILVGKHLNWFLYAHKVKHNGEEFVMLVAKNEDRNKYPLTYNVEYAIEANNSQNRIVSNLPQLKYDEPDHYARYGCRMITCNKFLNERDKYETDGKITGTAKIIVRMPMCYNFNGTKSLSDVTIKIGTELFQLSKTCLTFHSDFFHAMFFGEFAEAKKDEVTLTDVDIVAFVKLINVLFIRSFELPLKSVPPVLELADRFGLLSVVDHCEKLLVNCNLNSEPTLAERLVLATKYSLDGLQKRCLALCTSAKIAKDVMTSPFYKDLSAEGKVILLERMVEVLPAFVFGVRHSPTYIDDID